MFVVVLSLHIETSVYRTRSRFSHKLHLYGNALYFMLRQSALTDILILFYFYIKF